MVNSEKLKEQSLAARGDDKLLYTPGPLTTSMAVKKTMLRDLGSRDHEFIRIVKEIRQKLLEAGGVAGKGYETVIMQGSGTFGLESVLGSVIPPDGKLLVVVNGAYGRRLVQMAKVLKIECADLVFPEDTPAEAAGVKQALEKDPAITHVAIIHCETTTGLLNPIKEIGELVSGRGLTYIVDAMSSFGGIPTDIEACKIDYLISSANKCIEGVPGFSFAIVRREALDKTEGYARSLSLDLRAQLLGLEANGQFRFTPPTHSILAYHQALLELEEEGGVEGRYQRYLDNYNTLVAGMRELGFVEYLKKELQGPIITSFRFPESPNFKFEDFYNKLNEKNLVIYPGKVSDADCFRIGNIGRLYPEDVKGLLAVVKQVKEEMGF